MRDSNLFKSLSRLCSIAAGWILLLYLKLQSVNDPNLDLKVRTVSLFMIPTIFIMLVIQHRKKYKLSVWAEIIALPLIVGGLLYLAVLMRR